MINKTKFNSLLPSIILVISFIIVTIGCKKDDKKETTHLPQKQIIFQEDFNQRGNWKFEFENSYVPNIFEAKIDSGYLTLTFSRNIINPKGAVIVYNDSITNPSYLDTLKKIGFLVKIKEGSFQSMFNESTYYDRNLVMFYNGLAMRVPCMANPEILKAKTIEGKYDNGMVEVFIDGIKKDNPDVIVSGATTNSQRIQFYIGYRDPNNITRIDVLKIDYIEIYTW
jgi:hypothetical protein